MIILSTNIHGLGGKAKKLSLWNLCDNNKPDILLLQETMGPFDAFHNDLSWFLPGWQFIGIDSAGLSGGLISGFSLNITLNNSYVIEAGLFADIFNPDLNKQFKILNVYGPYVGKEAHWNKILGYQWFQDDNLILGGDLNLTVHKDEIWGSQGRVDKLSHFFQDRFEACNRIDVESVSLKPTRFNNRERADDIQKRLDRFLVKEEIFLSINHIRS